MRAAVLYKPRSGFHYDLDWKEAFVAYGGLHTEAFGGGVLDPRMWRSLLTSEAIILLHSVDPAYRSKTSRVLRELLKLRRGRLIYFPRNEFREFTAKRAFIQETSVDLVASQLPLEGATYLYGDLTEVMSLPHAANLNTYDGGKPLEGRLIMIGGRSKHYPPFLLDTERNHVRVLLEKAKELRPHWVIDYSVADEDRLGRQEWPRFLANCRFTVSSEAGASYLDRTDQLQAEIKRYSEANPDLDAAQLREIFSERIAELPPGRCISPRHFEAIGCRTCQVLVEGEYNGILRPGEHYIELKADSSNFEDVLAQMEDPRRSSEIVENSYEFIRSRHTHEHRIQHLLACVA